MSKRQKQPDLLADLAAEAMPDGRLSLTLFGPHDPLGAIALLAEGGVAARALADAIPAIMRGSQKHCGSCGEALDYPETIAVLHADRPDARAAIALGCCSACTRKGPAMIRRRLTAFLGTIFVGLRALDPTHAPPEEVQ